MILLTLASLFVTPSFAEEPCDGKALGVALVEATPLSTAQAYLDLSVCDPALTKKSTKAAFEKILSGTEGNNAALAAINLEQDGVVRAWLAALEPDERSRTIAFLGKTCKDDVALQGFFARAHADLGEQFWEDRWHRGLSDCRVESIQNILVEAIQKTNLKEDQSRFFTVLEVYSRNLGAAAVPTIAALAKATDDQEHLTYLVNALADAANVGGATGINPAAAKSATTALVEMGPKLPPRAVEQARKTLLAMGSDEQADAFAGHRWRDRKKEDTYLYAVTVTESATCKNGKSFANLHYALFDETGNLWPGQLQENIGEKLAFEWNLDGAEKCKGEGKIDVVMPKEPFASKEDAESWLKTQKSSFTSRTTEFDKMKSQSHEDFSY